MNVFDSVSKRHISVQRQARRRSRNVRPSRYQSSAKMAPRILASARAAGARAARALRSKKGPILRSTPSRLAAANPLRHGGSRFASGPPGLAAGSPPFRLERQSRGPPDRSPRRWRWLACPKDRQVRTPGNGGLLRAGRSYPKARPSALRVAIACRRPLLRRPCGSEEPPVLRRAGRLPATPPRFFVLLANEPTCSALRLVVLAASAAWPLARPASRKALPPTASALSGRLRTLPPLRHLWLGSSRFPASSRSADTRKLSLNPIRAKRVCTSKPVDNVDQNGG